MPGKAGASWARPARIGAGLLFRPDAAPVIKRPRLMTRPGLWFKSAAKQVTRPCPIPPRWARKRKSGGQGKILLPWRIPDPDADMWADYQACKAAGLLYQWAERYRYVLDLSSPEPCP